jgi:hypothetical protein
LYLGLVLMVVLGAALGSTAVLVVGIIALSTYSLIRALLPGH